MKCGELVEVKFAIDKGEPIPVNQERIRELKEKRVITYFSEEQYLKLSKEVAKLPEEKADFTYFSKLATDCEKELQDSKVYLEKMKKSFRSWWSPSYSSDKRALETKIESLVKNLPKYREDKAKRADKVTALEEQREALEGCTKTNIGYMKINMDAVEFGFVVNADRESSLDQLMAAIEIRRSDLDFSY